jgi:hypothetical protein
MKSFSRASPAKVVTMMEFLHSDSAIFDKKAFSTSILALPVVDRG